MPGASRHTTQTADQAVQPSSSAIIGSIDPLSASSMLRRRNLYSVATIRISGASHSRRALAGVRPVRRATTGLGASGRARGVGGETGRAGAGGAGSQFNVGVGTGARSTSKRRGSSGPSTRSPADGAGSAASGLGNARSARTRSAAPTNVPRARPAGTASVQPSRAQAHAADTPTVASATLIVKACRDRPRATIAFPAGTPAPNPTEKSVHASSAVAVTVVAPSVSRSASGPRPAIVSRPYPAARPPTQNIANSTCGLNLRPRLACAAYVGRRYTPGTADHGQHRREEEPGGFELAERLERDHGRDDGAHDSLAAGAQPDLGRPPDRERREIAHSRPAVMPRDSSTRGSWTTPTPIATTAPANRARTSVSRVKAAAGDGRKPSSPNEPTANEASLTTSFQNSRRAISSA